MWPEIVPHGYYILIIKFCVLEILFYYISNLHSNPWGTEEWPYRTSSFKYKHFSYTVGMINETGVNHLFSFITLPQNLKSDMFT